MSDDIPDPWRSAAERKGISPTYRPLAERAGLSHETVRKVIQGRKTSNASIAKMAAALGVDVEVIHRWRGEAPPDYGREFIPDQKSAALLTTEEREVVNSLIRLLTDARRSEQRAGEGHDRPAATNQAGESPAPKKRRDPFAGKKPMMQDRKDPANRGGTWLQTLGIVDADGQLVRDRVNPDDVIADLIAPLVERGMSEADAIRWLRNRAVHDAGATGFGPGLPQREFADDPDPEDYLLAASDVDDDPEAEGWQEEP